MEGSLIGVSEIEVAAILCDSARQARELLAARYDGLARLVDSANPDLAEMSEAEIAALCDPDWRPTGAADRLAIASTSPGCTCDCQTWWPSPKPGYWAAAANCNACGTDRFVIDPNQSAELPNAGRGEAPTPDNDDAATTEHRVDSDPAAEVGEQRRHHRQSLAAPLVGVPLDEALRPVAPACRLTLFDISVSGACLISEVDWEAPAVLLDFELAGAPGRQLVGALKWNRRDAGMTRFGCEFVSFQGPGPAA